MTHPSLFDTLRFFFQTHSPMALPSGEAVDDPSFQAAWATVLSAFQPSSPEEAHFLLTHLLDCPAQHEHDPVWAVGQCLATLVEQPWYETLIQEDGFLIGPHPGRSSLSGSSHDCPHLRP